MSFFHPLLRFKHLVTGLLLCCLGLGVQGVHAAQLAVVISSDEAAYKDFASSLKSLLQGSEWQIVWEGTPEKFQKTPPNGAQLIIAAGTAAARVALDRPEGPSIITSLLTQSAYEAVRLQFAAYRAPVSALFLDQPSYRQIAFIKKLFPDNHIVSMAVSDANRRLLPRYLRSATQQQLTLNAIVAPASEPPLSTLENMLAKADSVYLAVPDSTLFSRENIRPFLLTSYRYQRPVIAFSPAFVQAGALAALHSTPTQQAADLAQLLSRIKPTSTSVPLPPPISPTRFSVVFNPHVARSLKINLPSETSILNDLANVEEDKVR